MQQPDELIAPGLGDLADARRFLKHLLRLLYDPLADRRDGDLSLPSLEQQRAELFFQLLNRDGERRLADEALGGGATETSFLRDGDDVAKLVQRHRFFPARKLANPAPTSLCLSAKSTVASR